jgi:hypothetical protein
VLIRNNSWKLALRFLGMGANGYCLLVIGCWLLVIGCWLLVIGYWLLVIGYIVAAKNLLPPND